MNYGGFPKARVLIQDAGWVGGQHGWRDPIRTIFGSGWWRRWPAADLPGDGGAVWGERCQCGEVVAALAADRQRGAGQDGRSPQPILLSEREWLLARMAEKPDLTLRALVAELDERGVRASYGAVWRFFEREGISFKKNPVRQRAGSAVDSPGGERSGRSIRAGLIPGAWSSSTRPGPRPT